MKVKISRGFSIWIAVAAVVLLALIPLLRTSDKERINQLLDTVEELGSFEGDLHPLELLAWVKTVSQHTSDNLIVTYYSDNTQEKKVVVRDHNELEQKLPIFRKYLGQFAVKISERKIEVERDQATVRALARGIGKERGREDYFLEEHVVMLRLRKVDGEWKVQLASNEID